ncbi:MAG: hypothetical protein ABI432_03835 [Flavobacteriales bacterium]
MDFLSFLHSLMRYGVLLTVLFAFLFNLRGWLMDRPILTGERMVTILAMVLCHVQLVIGGLLYVLNWGALSSPDAGPLQHFVKYEHLGSMLIAIILITLGRSLSKRAKDERAKQMRVAIFYGIGLLLMLWATPWPFTEVGMGLGWL